MELYPGVHQIRSRFGDRDLLQYVFLGERTVLLDTGIDTTPATAILPYLQGLGVAPRQLHLAITLHPDLDHQGGNAELRQAHPAIALACHELDRALIEDLEALFRRRYEHLVKEHGLGLDPRLRPLAGKPVNIDVALRGGERIHLGPGWELEVWHLPGHSAGHLGLYDSRHRALFSSDAVQAAGCPSVHGGLALAPTYYSVDAYLATIHFLEHKPIEHLYSGHWPDAHGPHVIRFLEESRAFVERAEERVIAELGRAGAAGASLGELACRLGPQLGTWPAETHTILMFALYGHLERLTQRGWAARLPGQLPVRWRSAEPPGTAAPQGV
jgi:glyoxylase-like metal-dependent hydrolase (beta-lactamase superfamily II)